VLDASALLALMNAEPGAEEIGRLIAAEPGAVSTVNFSEVVAKLNERGVPIDEVRDTLSSLRLEVIDFDVEAAYQTGQLRSRTRQAGLSLGDRACLALAVQRGLPAITTDRSWNTLQLGIDVRVVR
jgi:PIN domain nuclease of toxin-antitoxin system